MKYLIVLSAFLLSCTGGRDIDKSNETEKHFYNSCEQDKIPYYKCNIMWNNRYNNCSNTSSGIGNAMVTGAAMGATGAVVKKLLK